MVILQTVQWYMDAWPVFDSILLERLIGDCLPPRTALLQPMSWIKREHLAHACVEQALYCWQLDTH